MSTDEAMCVVGARIRDLRTAHGMTQGALAQACFVSQVAVSLWERGLRRPGDLARRDLAETLKLPAHALFRELDDADREAVA